MNKKHLKIIAALISGVGLLFGIVALWVFLSRIALPYNSEGNYFDVTSDIVYHQQSCLVFGVMAVVSFLVAGIGYALSRRKGIHELPGL